jgi:hypothetical protein
MRIAIGSDHAETALKEASHLSAMWLPGFARFPST